jgi:CRP-like cAMP-binding protein
MISITNAKIDQGGPMLSIAQLNAFAILEGFPEDIVNRIGQSSQLFDYASRDIIIKEGLDATHMYGVVAGEVELSIHYRDQVVKTDVKHEDYVHKRVETIEKNIVVEVLEPGEIFAWSAFCAPHKLTSTATCTQASRVAAIDGAELRAILAQAPETGYLFAQRVAEVISRRLRNRTARLLETWHEAFGVENV